MLKHLPFNFYQLNLMNFLLFTVLVSNKIVKLNRTIKRLLSGLIVIMHIHISGLWYTGFMGKE